MSRLHLTLLALVAPLFATAPAMAQSEANLGAMLGQAQKFTVKVRGTVHWPFVPEQIGSGTGTGFIIDRDKGWIITNAHVAKRSPATVEVSLTDVDGDWVPAERVYVDNHLDIAVLKVASDKVPASAAAAKLGCKQSVKQGATVVAYGHPINLNFTATRGIVSSVRTLGSNEFVQMDANINPGNSGGPLLSVEAAEVIGVNTLNFPGAPGLGLAISIRQICPIIDLLAAGADPSLPSLPVYWLKLGPVETLTVAALFRQASSEPARGDDGLKPGDIIQGVAGETKLASVPDLFATLRGRKDQVKLNVMRDGKPLVVTSPLIAAKPPLKRQAVTFAGLLVAERISIDTADLNLPPLRIEFIKPGEVAARAGLRPGDHLEMVGGQRFQTVAALHAWIAAKPPAEKIAILVRRSVGFDPRVTSEYSRYELPATDLKLITAGDPSP